METQLQVPLCLPPEMLGDNGTVETVPAAADLVVAPAVRFVAAG